MFLCANELHAGTLSLATYNQGSLPRQIDRRCVERACAESRISYQECFSGVESNANAVEDLVV